MDLIAPDLAIRPIWEMRQISKLKGSKPQYVALAKKIT
jgi:hypothetical protein